MTFEAVLFDLDGVITDTAEYHYRAWKKLADSLGITIDRRFNEQLKGVSREDSLQRILTYGGMQNAFPPEKTAGLLKQKNDWYVEMIQTVTPADVYPGILELLHSLKAAGKKTALASASKNGSFLLEKMALTPYFDAIADPAEVARSKPAPDIFLAAAQKIGVPIGRCIGIEDASAGIAAIKAAGALPVGIGNPAYLGSDIAVLPDTRSLTVGYLQSVWDTATPVRN
ncbi:beta-phosphoglucomutase [Neisseria leonii]|uniref:Beta-phosphoglucomutase n=1 Tax=Neisseria leonii TaxID=2995413 RepID=A0A9X4DZT1_9NEIS|nr:beta-phosphoglucomutase [Neisseria sp. 51.81]MDD9326781.1 beta-phosphoglucomutase [Neisseria sp. 51.81]